MNTNRYALFDAITGHRISEIVVLTDEQYNSVKRAIQWKYDGECYIWQYDDKRYEITSQDIMSTLEEHSLLLEKNRIEIEEASRKRKRALYEKLKRELGE